MAAAAAGHSAFVTGMSCDLTGTELCALFTPYGQVTNIIPNYHALPPHVEVIFANKSGPDELERRMHHRISSVGQLICVTRSRPHDEGWRKRKQEDDDALRVDRAKKLREDAQALLDQAEDIEEEAKRLKAPFDPVVGAVVKGESQTLRVSKGIAPKPVESKWVVASETISMGEEWFWSKLRADGPGGPLYLIWDEDDDSEITVFRNPSLVSNTAYTLAVMQYPRF